MRRVILDTNIISALFRAQENPHVKRWFLRQKLESLSLTSINLAEMLFGVRRLAHGRRREALEQWLRDSVYPNFAARLLPFDERAADAWAGMHAADCARGKPRPLIDGLIAAIAKANGCAIATRDQRDFRHLEIDIINPFEDS